MDRRKVLSWVGLGWLASMLPPVLTSCVAAKQTENSLAATSPPKSLASSPVATTVIPSSRVIGSIAQLNRDGQLTADGVIVVRDRNNPQSLFAVNPICTHKGCDVSWQSNNQEFYCPCHDATFAPDGSVRQAPTRQPLATYAVKVENEQVLISSVGDANSSSNIQNNNSQSTNSSSRKRDRQSSEYESDEDSDRKDRDHQERQDRKKR